MSRHEEATDYTEAALSLASKGVQADDGFTYSVPAADLVNYAQTIRGLVALVEETKQEAVKVLLEAAPPLNVEMSMQGGAGPFVDPGMAAYVEGFGDAYGALNAWANSVPVEIMEPPC